MIGTRRKDGTVAEDTIFSFVFAFLLSVLGIPGTVICEYPPSFLTGLTLLCVHFSSMGPAQVEQHQ